MQTQHSDRTLQSVTPVELPGIGKYISGGEGVGGGVSLYYKSTRHNRCGGPCRGDTATLARDRQRPHGRS